MNSYFYPANILLPRSDFEHWACIACDQYTSELDYWDRVKTFVSENPSTYKLIFPEAYLDNPEYNEHMENIPSNMKSYLDNNIIFDIGKCFLYIEREVSGGIIRRGLIGAIDLEAYDWHPGSVSPIRATEDTVASRVTARIKIRAESPLEMPHIIMFIDNPEDDIICRKDTFEKVYDFDLMEKGGNIKGYKVDSNSEHNILCQLYKLSTEAEYNKKYPGNHVNKPFAFAIGDGNHSLAAAKENWERHKALGADSDNIARFALVELVNIYDEGVSFYPIHKMLFGTNNAHFIEQFKERACKLDGDIKYYVNLIIGNIIEKIFLPGLSIGQVNSFCEEFCVEYTKSHGGYIDYIHDEESVKKLCEKQDSVAVIMPDMKKEDLFKSVIDSGVFPKKSFSVGHSSDKRYYLEVRKIK